MKGQRQASDPLDRYYTPSWVTRLLTMHWPWPDVREVGEPCAGQGHIVRELAAHGLAVEASDFDPASPYRTLDFLSPPGTPGFEQVRSRYEGIGAIVTNPPYTIPGATAADFVRRALELTDRVAMVLRLPWLEPCDDRLSLFRHQPPRAVWILPRVHFEGPNIDPGKRANGATSAWFIWCTEELETIRWFGPDDRQRAEGQRELAI